jgi:hypothetical protein
VAILFNANGEALKLSTTQTPLTLGGQGVLDVDKDTYACLYAWESGDPGSNTSAQVLATTDSGGTNLGAYDGASFTSGVTVTVGTWFNWAVSIGATPFPMVVYLTNTLTGSVTVLSLGNISPTGLNRILLGCNSYSAEYWAGRVDNVWAEDAVLTQAQIERRWKTRRPQRSQWLWTPMVHSTVADCLKDMSGNGRDWTQLGTLSIGDGAPVSWGSPVLVINRAAGGAGTLDGTAAGAGTASGTLTGTGALAGTAAGAATPTGTLTGTGALVGTAAGAGSQTGALTGTGALAGLTDGTGAATGTLTAAGALAGTGAGAGASSGTLTAAGALAGTAAGAGSASGDLTDGGSTGVLEGTAAGAGAASGTLTASGALVGTAAGAAGASGDLTGAGALVGTAAGASTPTGDLTGIGALAGTAAGSSAAAGTLTGTANAAGTAAGSGTATGTWQATALISGTAAGLGIANGDLRDANATNTGNGTIDFGDQGNMQPTFDLIGDP